MQPTNSLSEIICAAVMIEAIVAGSFDANVLPAPR
jgi:hypothetical protein